MKTFFVTLKRNNIRYGRFILFYIASSLIVSVSIVFGQILAGEMGQAAYQFDTGAILNFMIVLTGVMAIRAIFSALSALFLGRFSGTTAYNFRVNFAKFFLFRSFAKLEKTNSGESLSVFTNDLLKSVQFVSDGALTIISDFMLLIIALAYMFYINWLHTIIFIAAFPVLALIQVIISIPIQKTVKVALEAQSGFNAVVNDSLQNTATVIAYSLEQEVESRYVAAYKQFYNASLRYLRFVSTFVVAGFIASAFPLVFLFIASGVAVVNGTLLISDFIVYTGIGMIAAGWLMDLAQSLGDIRVWMAGAARLNEFTTGELEDIGNKRSLVSSGNVAVAFENVSFVYADDASEVLRNISFEIPRKAKVAIVGGSGSGKSTILKLLLGLYEPKSGKISVLGNDIVDIGKYALRDSFAYVPQDSFLFPVSIRENITGETEISPQEQVKLEECCRDAGILDFITNMPNKFDSVLTESAENISGGQRQRIAMARAFYKDAPIILFDEATSALDPTTEAEILETLKDAAREKTIIMVAHRAAAKAFCDTVIALEGGCIV